GFTPVAAAAQDHLDVVLYLVEKGADAVDEALFPAIRANDARLVRAVLETSKVEPLDLEAARRTDTEKQSPEIKELLARAPAAPRRTAPYSIPGERLEAYAAARYRAQGGPGGAPMEATVQRKGDGLVLATAGQPDLVLQAVREDRFQTAAEDAMVVCGGGGGLVEWMRVTRGGDVAFFSVVPSNPSDLPVAAAAPPAASPARRPPIDWPSFRGPGGSGVGDGQGIPMSWDVAAGKNVRFRT